MCIRDRYSFATVSSSSTSSSDHLYASAYFFLIFSEDVDIFRVISYKLRLFTPCSSYGVEEMTPKSQLCACSFQDTIGYQTIWIRCVWTRKFSYPQKKYLRKKNFPDTCGHISWFNLELLKYLMQRVAFQGAKIREFTKEAATGTATKKSHQVALR